MPDRVSVVIPTRDRLGFLQEAVASIRKQSYPHWELIVVDDASTDGTWAWLQTLENERIRAVRMEKHSERCVARNRGLEAATGRSVLFLDDDDRLASDALGRLAVPLARKPRAVACIGARLIFNGAGRTRRVPHPRVSFAADAWSDLLFGWSPVPGQCLIVRDGLHDVGGWNESLRAAEDLELWLRLMRGGPVICVPAPVLENRFHEGQRRPAEGAGFNRQLREEAVSRLGEGEQRVAERILHARDARRDALAAFEEGRFAAALRGYAAACRSYPRLLVSPIWGPYLLARILKSGFACIGGGATMRRLQSAKGALRARRGRGSMGNKDIETAHRELRR
ncbi:MAG: glycosyltransferase family 2 protein [Actinomycetota bacterium]